MQSIAKVQTVDRTVNQLQSNIISAVNPILANPIVSGTILTSVSLVVGSNTISHNLNRNLQGWIIIRQRALSQIYDTQDSNPNPSITLILVASSAVVVDLYVF